MQICLVLQTRDSWKTRGLYIFLTYGALSALYAPVQSCKNTEDDLISLAKFSESDPLKASAILKESTIIREAHAFKRFGDCMRWQAIMLAKWAETQDPPIQWDYLRSEPFNLPMLEPSKRKEYEQVKQKHAFHFKMLKINPDVMPHVDAFKNMEHVPYNLRYPPWGMGVYRPIAKQRPGIFARLGLDRIISDSTRWTETLGMNFEGDQMGKEVNLWEAFWRYVLIVLVRNEAIGTEFPFDKGKRKWSRTLFFSSYIFGIFCSAFLAVNSFISVADLALNVTLSCETMFDCSGEICMIAGWEGRIGDGVCNSEGAMYCNTYYPVNSMGGCDNGGLLYRHTSSDVVNYCSPSYTSVSAAGLCPDGLQAFSLYSLDLNCPKFDYDGGDCKLVPTRRELEDLGEEGGGGKLGNGRKNEF